MTIKPCRAPAKPQLGLWNFTLFWVIGLGLSLPANAEDKVDFGKEIYPILKESCLQCHAAPYTDAKTGKLKKPKGGVRLDTPEEIMKDHEDEDGSIKKMVIPGKPNESSFYTLTTLPEDDDNVMPQKGDLLTKNQQELIRKWIEQGAEFGTFKAPEYINPKAKQ